MTMWQAKSRRKITGGRRRYHRKKRKFELGTDFHPAVIATHKNKRMKSRGGNHKTKVMGAEHVNLSTPDGKMVRVKIQTVVENPANPNYVQRNILTKGAIINTPKGKARVTSKPGKDGVINAVAIEE